MIAQLITECAILEQRARELGVELPEPIECHGCGELMSEDHARYMQDDGCQDAPVCCDCAAEYRRMGRVIR